MYMYYVHLLMYCPQVYRQRVSEINRLSPGMNALIKINAIIRTAYIHPIICNIDQIPLTWGVITSR